MKVIIAGDCQKHDYVLAAACLIKAYTDKTVTVITDADENYRYFNGEVSGIRIDVEVPKNPNGILIYDWHYGLPDLESETKLVLATSYEKRSIESILNILKLLKGKDPTGLVVVESEGRITNKYIEKTIPLAPPMVTSYFDSSSRRIDWVHDGRVNLKVEKDFAFAVQDLLMHVFDVPEKDLKKLWTYARRRG